VINVRVLLADDHEIVLRGLEDMLRRVPGLEVVGTASDGAEALRLARELEPDVVVLDVSMPGMDGIRATTRMSRDCPDVRVLALTMHDDRAHLSRILREGAAGYVLKRSAPDQLLRAIRAVAGGHSWVDPLLAGHLMGGAAREPADAESPGELSRREEEVLRSLAWGHSNKETAERLGISPRTVETYRARIRDKLGLASRNEMVRYALQHGWLTED
jgi:DNA-binding NarL/FixJ family response regulator